MARRLVEEEMRELLWLDRSGGELGVTGVAQPGIVDFALSPQGDRGVLSASEGSGRDRWLQDLERGTKNQLTFSPDSVRGSSFSPDGRLLAYTADESGRMKGVSLPVSRWRGEVAGVLGWRVAA